MPPLSDADRLDLLDHGRPLVRIGTVDAEGAPRVVPAWFLHRDGAILFTPRARSAWLGDLRRDPRVALSIDEEARPYRKLTARGRAELLHDVGHDDEWRDLYHRLSARYVGDEAADRYLRATWDEPRALFGLDLGDAEVHTWRMPLGEEDPTGIWADRYYGA